VQLGRIIKRMERDPTANMSAIKIWTNLESAQKLSAMIGHARATSNFSLLNKVQRMPFPTHPCCRRRRRHPLPLPSPFFPTGIRLSPPSASHPTVTSHASPQLLKLNDEHPDHLSHAILIMHGHENSADAKKAELGLTEAGRQLLTAIENIPYRNRGVGSVRSNFGFIRLANLAQAQQVGRGSSCRSRLCPPAPRPPSCPQRSQPDAQPRCGLTAPAASSWYLRPAANQCEKS
jgi:hypothetical protein